MYLMHPCLLLSQHGPCPPLHHGRTCPPVGEALLERYNRCALGLCLHAMHLTTELMQPGGKELAPRGAVWVQLAEVDQKAVPKVLGNIAIKAANHLSAGLLIGAYHVSEVFGVELAG